jgi:hypothetical protein
MVEIGSAIFYNSIKFFNRLGGAGGIFSEKMVNGGGDTAFIFWSGYGGRFG